MAGRGDKAIMARLLDSITVKGASLRQLSRRSGADCKTTRKFIDLIVMVQSSPRIRLEIDGLRVVVKREIPASPVARIGAHPPGQVQLR